MPHRPSARWLAFASLSFIFFVVSAGAFSSLGVVLPRMVAELGWNWKQAGLGYTLLGLSCGFASLAPAMIIRRLGVKWTLSLGAAGMVLGFAALALTQTVAVYWLAATLIGIAFALVSIVPGAHVLTGLFEARRSTVLGAYFTLGALGGVAGPLLWVLADHAFHAWRPFWWGFAGLSLVAGLFAATTVPKGDLGEPALAAPQSAALPQLVEGLKDWTVRRALAAPQFYVIVGGYTSYLLINTTAHGFAAQHLIERGVDGAAAAQMLAYEQLFGALVSVFVGALGERLSSKTLMILSLGAVAVGMAALAEARGWPLMWVFVIGVGLGFGLSFVASTVLLLKYFGQRANLELFSIMCLISTSAALGPAFGGWARDALGSFTDMFLLCAALALMVLVPTLFLRPPQARTKAALTPAA